MSGPTLGESVYRRIAFDKPEKISRETVRKIRELAEDIERGYWDDEIEHPDAIACALRSKADKVEAHLDVIENELHDDFAQLAKAIEWTNAADYGPSRIDQAWKEYGDER